MKLLIVEPDTVMGQQLRRWFIKAGHKVMLADTAQAAIDTVEAGSPDAILLELAMPHHNGIEFLYELRSYAEWQHIPVVVCTLQKLCSLPLLEGLGVSGHFYKPTTSLSELLGHVARHEPASL